MHGMSGNLQVKRSVTKLRSLLTFGITDPQSLSCISQVLGSSRMLRVLDLRGASLKMISEIIFKLFHLRYLSLINTNVKVLPRSIKRLKQLEILDLKQTYVTELPVEILKLENLPHLLVYSCVSYSYLLYNCSPGYTGEELYFEQGKFQRLKLLNLDKSDGLRRVTISEGAIPHLEKMVVQRCALLESVPTGIECLLNLKVLEFFDMPDEFITTLHPDKQGAYSWKVSHIGEVFYTYRRDDCWMVYSLKEKGNSQIPGHSGAVVTRTYGRRNFL
ncbi:hypothetical protein FXO37_29546 [Capsicum annuum]|nr:hypothetical protein FXO37_29546 [Capsicum annuum]